jgi:hypothetical protein
MALGKQAKPPTEAQQAAVLERLKATRHPARNRAIFPLSIDAALRAKEIGVGVSFISEGPLSTQSGRYECKKLFSTQRNRRADIVASY